VEGGGVVLGAEGGGEKYEEKGEDPRGDNGRRKERKDLMRLSRRACLRA
jgi:hypothetical protein